VINIVPTADRQKATVRVRIAFDTLEPRILPDMGVKVSFLDDAQKVEASSAAPRATVRVPAGSVVKDGENAYVWRVRDNRLERVAVRVGAERDGQVDVLSGINGGELVVTKQIDGLAEGAPVKEKGAE
jgi:hypothetical protein